MQPVRNLFEAFKRRNTLEFNINRFLALYVHVDPKKAHHNEEGAD